MKKYSQSRKLASKFKAAIFSASLFALASAGFSEEGAYVFKDGERVCFAGDSITFSGEYMEYVQTYYATRFPSRRVEFFNCGISGDKAYMMTGRLDDIYRHKPTYICLMLGMNDMENKLYAPQNKGKDLRAEREAANQIYFETMGKLVKDFRAHAEKVVLITPSIYDESAVMERENWAGRGGTLKLYAQYIKDTFPQMGVKIVDVNTLMDEVNLREQAKDPKFTIVGKDRVHPHGPGSFVMAYKFLKDTGAPKYVSRMEIDARGGKVSDSENCEIKDLKAGADDVEFSCKAGALPMPVVKAAAPGPRLVPFFDDLNVELFRVKNLPDGDYELAIDGETVGSYHSGALAEGVNLAKNRSTPQYRQALEITNLVHDFRLAYKDYVFKIRHVEHHDLRPHVDVKDSAAVEKYIEEKVASLPEKDPLAKRLISYKANKKIEGELFAEAMKRRDAIFAACSSAVVGRGYSLKRVASAENSN